MKKISPPAMFSLSRSRFAFFCRRWPECGGATTLSFPRRSLRLLSGTLQTGRLEAGGLERSFAFYEPRQLAGNAPLVVALHGANSSGQKLRAFTGYEFDALADRYGFMVAYPDSFAGSWNDCRVASNNPARRQGIDDVGFVKAVIANLKTRYQCRRFRLRAGILDGRTHGVPAGRGGAGNIHVRRRDFREFADGQ